MIELFAAGATFLGALGPLLAKTVTSRQEEHAAILAELQAATIEFLKAVEELSYKLVTQDKAADEALQEKFDHSEEKKP